MLDLSIIQAQHPLYKNTYFISICPSLVDDRFLDKQASKLSSKTDTEQTMHHLALTKLLLLALLLPFSPTITVVAIPNPLLAGANTLAAYPGASSESCTSGTECITNKVTKHFDIVNALSSLMRREGVTADHRGGDGGDGGGHSSGGSRGSGGAAAASGAEIGKSAQLLGMMGGMVVVAVVMF